MTYMYVCLTQYLGYTYTKRDLFFISNSGIALGILLFYLSNLATLDPEVDPPQLVPSFFSLLG